MHDLKLAQPNNQDLIKFIAIVCMIIDHVGFFFLIHDPVLRAIGRVCLPIFAFFAGYNFKTIHYDILVYGLIITLFRYAFQSALQSNILITFFIGQVLFTYAKPKILDIFFVVSILIGIACNYCHFVEYSTFTLSFMICGLWAKGQEPFKMALFISFLTFIIFTQIVFRFSPIYLLLVSLLQIGSYYSFSYVNFTTPRNCKLLFASRYLLEIYFWHFIIFLLIWFFAKI
ncbi:hypothetical protein phytr_6940 [Candidatus Phycorickettsia trachydisci]|uniref:TraX family protein n=1 Tax=Candidatus Phycorickettsia trachydisci TaxID=2115978 RepID=A0A2P1P8R5_9RICK|nr:hypothetical protein phytr_6940 [Candidatus Phycorickettsia trachydisci]